jgi:hypothetical protein
MGWDRTMNCRNHVSVKPCPQCEGTGWVCENHIDQPWDGIHGCTCGGAGAPCPRCNSATLVYPPRLPKGLKPESDR